MCLRRDILLQLATLQPLSYRTWASTQYFTAFWLPSCLPCTAPPDFHPSVPAASGLYKMKMLSIQVLFFVPGRNERGDLDMWVGGEGEGG